MSQGGVSAEEAEGRAKLLLHKKLTPPEGPYYSGRPINITLQVWNQGPGNAYSVVVTDENWKQDKFRTVFQGNNFTLDFLNAGEQYVHEFTVVPVKTILAHRVKPAKVRPPSWAALRPVYTRSQHPSHTATAPIALGSRWSLSTVSRARAPSRTTRADGPRSRSSTQRIALATTC